MPHERGRILVPVGGPTGGIGPDDLVALAGWVFGVVLQDVPSGESFNPVDRPVLNFLVAHREPWLTHVATRDAAVVGQDGGMGDGDVIAVMVAATRLYLGALWFTDWSVASSRPAVALGAAELDPRRPGAATSGPRDR